MVRGSGLEFSLLCRVGTSRSWTQELWFYVKATHNRKPLRSREVLALNVDLKLLAVCWYMLRTEKKIIEKPRGEGITTVL